MPARLGTLSAPPVFICGSARSGTTWTFDLFNGHPQVHAICESWILSQTHGVTSLMTQSYWDTDVRAEWERRVDMPFGTGQLLSYTAMVRELGDLLAGWLMRGADDRRYLAAKEAIDVRAASILFPEARFVHVIRDGRSVARSMERASQTWDPSMGVGLSMGMRGEAWRRQVENVRAHASELGSRYLEIRYEDMRSDTTAAIRTLFDFGGIDYDDGLISEISRSTRLTSYGEGSRLSGFRGGSQGATGSRPFSLREAFDFHLAAGELLVELGYEPNWRWVLKSARRS